jgi:hypothetical protein
LLKPRLQVRCAKAYAARRSGALRFAATAGQSRGMTRKLENLTIRLEPETREALERLAVREDRPLTYLIRRVLRAEAAQREPAEGRAA